ncbi:RNA-binding protein [Nakamurella sp. YIM 132087]|uniref:RNA-binding protein n=1 Tax=Nakamurella alba TaxID=2665158 RepID=A0A7K1FHE7_9ACTN|nr:CGNR zinc finger domain-containing protein [Nakamurella alba]MTD12879.1 RNA-binding protein [Nakamurella alba]
MVFPHDTEYALESAAALVNTGRDPSGTDLLPDVAGLDTFVDRWGWTGRRDHDETELAAVQALRPRLEVFWGQDRDAAVDMVNELLAEFRALPQLVRHDQWDYHLHATRAEAPLADRMAVEAAMAIVDVIRLDELGRLLVCAATDCTDVHIDLSRNRSRRFCSTGCANRTNVAAFRARRANAV